MHVVGASLLLHAACGLALSPSEHDPVRWVLPPQCNASSTFMREALTKAEIVKAKMEGKYATLSHDFIRASMKYARGIFQNYLKKELPELKNPKLLDVGCGSGYYDIFVHRHYNHRLKLFYFDGRTEDPKSKNMDGYHTDVKIMPFYKNDLSCTRDFAVANGVLATNVQLVSASVENLAAFAGTLDMIYSYTSWGFHYPVSTYASAAFSALKPGGKLLLTLRAGKRVKLLVAKAQGDGQRQRYSAAPTEDQRQSAIRAGFECAALPAGTGLLSSWLPLKCTKPS